MTDFKSKATPRARFSTAPLLTIQQAFAETARELPGKGSIVFSPGKGGIIVDVYPFCGPGPADGTTCTEEPSHLSYQLFPEHRSALIWRVKGYRHYDSDNPDNPSRSGIGAALFASQYPFWQKMGVESLAVSWTSSRGFYERLGFDPVDHLPELPQRDPDNYNLMRLDFTNPEQKTRFLHAIGKSRPLSSIDLAL
ncbi:MAG: hypothetical protein HYS17_03625 [Micavibrio aeruginosavorus]|uniref:Uncharacterized protein n=1 Tax=Micavibrio aeruginosavorus TaxID=349221 RepID=A0A7T5UIN5_9BACT|nr:MAG: hypothetical protein HYS17_03625 [Micavibrio aeruginosavorus]